MKPKPSKFPVAKVWQVGSFAGDALQIILVVLPDRTEFNEALAQLVVRVPGRFVVLSPTSVHHDLASMELLGRVHAGCYDLESNLTILPSGRLVARKTAGELFWPHLPENQEALRTTEAARIVAILKKLKSKRAGMKAPLFDVFTLIVFEGVSQKAAAEHCECSRGLMSKRGGELEIEFGRSLKQLQAVATQIAETRTRSLWRYWSRRRFSPFSITRNKPAATPYAHETLTWQRCARSCTILSIGWGRNFRRAHDAFWPPLSSDRSSAWSAFSRGRRSKPCWRRPTMLGPAVGTTS